MDKTQVRELFKSIKDSLPKEITATVRDNPGSTERTFTANITSIKVGKGYGGSYTANLDNGEILTTMQSDNIVSITYNGNVYNKVQEKKAVAKQEISQAKADELTAQFAALKVGDKVAIKSTESRFNNNFEVVISEPVHAPMKQHKLGIKIIGQDLQTYILSRRDSNFIISAEKAPDDAQTV